MSKQIRVSEAVKSTLEDIRDEKGHTNLDSALREVMIKADVEINTPDEADGEDKRIGGWNVDE